MHAALTVASNSAIALRSPGLSVPRGHWLNDLFRRDRIRLEFFNVFFALKVFRTGQIVTLKLRHRKGSGSGCGRLMAAGLWRRGMGSMVEGRARSKPVEQQPALYRRSGGRMAA
jgi:hypothetical protein